MDAGAEPAGPRVVEAPNAPTVPNVRVCGRAGVLRLANLFPACVVSVHGAGVAPLPLARRREPPQGLENASQARLAEHAAARACAHAALQRLGIPAPSIPIGPQGAPIWPTGAIGTLSHSNGHFAAAVARDRDLRAIGVDLEANRRITSRLLQRITSPRERKELSNLDNEHAHFDAVLFSAKEAAYKAWFPFLHGDRLGFLDARVSIALTGQLLVTPTRRTARVLPPLEGRWSAQPDLVTVGLFAFT